MAARDGLAANFIAHCSDGKILNQLPGTANFERDDWSFTVVHASGIAFVAVVVYLDCNTGIEGANLGKLAEIGACIQRLTVPFLILADWNVSPSDLHQRGWVEKVHGVIMTPSDLEFTCLSKTGSLIDYAVVDKRLLHHVVDFGMATCSPCTPHIGLMRRLQLRPKSILVRAVWQPKTLSDS